MTPRFELPEEFNVNNAYDTLEKLRLWLAGATLDPDAVLEISAQAVMEIDGTGMQLLAALSQSGYRWKICQPSTKFESACHTLGLDGWLTRTVSPPAGLGLTL